MKNIFRKAITVLGSAALIGATVGAAVAASYPSPFTSNTAIVYGASAAPADQLGATNIASDLSAAVAGTTSGSTTVTGGDSVLLQRKSDLLNVGDSAATVMGRSITSEDMENLLASGTYTDDQNTEYDYTQKVSLGSNLVVEHFADSDYKDKEPSIGIKLNDDEHVLNYTLDFTTHPHFNDTYLETTSMVIMGKNYYVLDVVNSTTSTSRKITLLDSANSGVVTEGETLTIAGKTVSVEYISATETRLSVDGEVTNSLAEGGTYKLTDGTYVGIKDILYNSKDTGISKVEVSLGTGKLELQHGSAAELNDVNVEEIVGYIEVDSVLDLDKIVLKWATDDEAFIASDSELTMPGFEAVKLSSSGLITSAAEETEVDYDGSDAIELKTTITDGAVTIPLLKANSSGDYTVLGKDTSNRLKTSAKSWIFVNETAGDQFIVASWNSTSESESYYLEVDMVSEDNVNKVQFKNVVDPTVIKKAANASEVTFGSVTLTVNNVTKDGSKKWANISINSAGSFHELYTAEGLKVFLPYFNTVLTDGAEGAINVSTNDTVVPTANVWSSENGIYNNLTMLSTAGHGFNTFYVFLDEEDKDGNLAAGTMFNVTVDDTTDNKVTISTVDIGDSSGTYGYEIGSSDDYEAYVNSALATKTLFKTGGTQDNVVITYAGEQANVELRLSSPEATVVSGDETGVVTVTDAQVSTVAGKNLIVVGGSCINSVAAELLTSAYCEAAFTTATGVANGEFLIQSFPRGGKTALLVAGYNAADTTKAVDYLINEANTVDTTVGTKYTGTSATEASLVVA